MHVNPHYTPQADSHQRTAWPDITPCCADTTLCCIATGHLSSWVPHWLQHKAWTWSTPHYHPFWCPQYSHLRWCATKELHQLPLRALLYKFSTDVGLSEHLAHIMRWGSIKAFNFYKLESKCQFLKHKESWKGRENIFSHYLPSTSVFLSSPWQNTAASCLLKESGSPRHRTAFIMVQKLQPIPTLHLIAHNVYTFSCLG